MTNPFLRLALLKYRRQMDAAAAWGISPQYACDIANGRRRVPPGLAVRIEMATGIDAAELYGWQTEQELRAARKGNCGE